MLFVVIQGSLGMSLRCGSPLLPLLRARWTGGDTPPTATIQGYPEMKRQSITMRLALCRKSLRGNHGRDIISPSHSHHEKPLPVRHNFKDLVVIQLSA